MGNLSNEQINAVECEDNVLLIACPGSGKTHTLTYKVMSELMKIDTHRKFVIAITYTNNAADEIRERIENLDVNTEQLWIGTIHSFCLEWIIRPYSIFVDSLPVDFVVLSEHGRIQAAKKIFSKDNDKKVKEILDALDSYRRSIYEKIMFKNNPQLPEEFSEVNELYSQYIEKIKNWKMLDFQMILEYSYYILSEHDFVCRNLRNIFPFIAIDEYQDTQSLQYLIFSKIVGGSEDIRLFMVGDPNQAIYGSLGGMALSHADIESLMGVRFVEMNLSKNYRSSSALVDYSKGYMVHPMDMVSEGEIREYKSRIFALDCRNSGVTSANIGSCVSDIIKYNIFELGIEPSEICILAPWWTHVSSITRKLKGELGDVPINGAGLSPFKGSEMGLWSVLSKIALTYPSIDMYSKRIFWSEDVLNILSQEMSFMDNDLTAADILKLSNHIKKSLDKKYDNNSAAKDYLNEFFDMFLAALPAPLAQISSIIRSRSMFFSGFEARVDSCLKKDGVNVGRLGFCRLLFINQEGIRVSTIHAVKGQEYDSVILTSVLDDYIPHQSTPANKKSEEANKILYVASTRARKNLWLIAESQVDKNMNSRKRFMCEYVSKNDGHNIFEIDPSGRS
ncbi:UvrD-helicase domain-containing protein [Rothia mucilaginosa]|uniref:UvrD-helicase domain-containing protein n=1 Tax=Rothia mucilaginosa TaxID=43675 RepID=UPI0026EC3A2C|nr:ATP-dependent helicase [Rothia mucilaginosa]